MDGQYMGLWATDQAACEKKDSPERWLLQPTDLLTSQFHCKLLGLRQDDASGIVFMASCKDAATKWNDEIAIKAGRTALSLSLKSDGQQRQLIRCGR